MTSVDRRVPRCVHVIWLGSDLPAALGALSHIRVMKIDVEGHEPNVLAGAMSLVESGRVDDVDIEAVRRHLGPRAEALGDLLARWEGEGVTFWDIGPRGRLVRHSRPIREVLAGADHGHLVIDARIFGDRARSGSGAP